MACALGLIASPYVASSLDFDGNRVRDPESSTANIAEAFCMQARAIIGVLPFSLRKIQCLFFCGVYEMYCIRPVSAWLDFSQASMQLKVYLQCRTSMSQQEFETPEGRLIQRLYWSCMQSEWYVYHISLSICPNAHY